MKPFYWCAVTLIAFWTGVFYALVERPIIIGIGLLIAIALPLMFPKRKSPPER